MRIRSVLVIPFADGIGDFINMQPLLAAIRTRFPEAEVTVAVSEHGRLLCNDPAIRTLKPAAFKHEQAKRVSGVRWLLPQTVLAWFAGPLFDRELGPFDLVINCFYAWERAMNFERTWTPQVPPVPDAVHSLDCLAEELERELSLGIPPETRVPHLVLRPTAQAWAAEFMQAQGLDDGRPLVALVPGTNMLIKRWPLSRWLDFEAQLRAAMPDVRTLLLCDRPVDPTPWRPPSPLPGRRPCRSIPRSTRSPRCWRTAPWWSAWIRGCCTWPPRWACAGSASLAPPTPT